nr:MAG TPA: hypothetical protein [Caudoviricetes sp.]
MTNEQCNALLTGGLSIEGLMAFVARKHNQPAKISKQAWLDNKKDCAHCKYDGNCKKQVFGYYRDGGCTVVKNNDNRLEAVYDDENGYTNGMIKPGAGYQSCCVWSMEMMIMLDEAYYKAKDKGEVE